MSDWDWRQFIDGQVDRQSCAEEENVEKDDAILPVMQKYTLRYVFSSEEDTINFAYMTLNLFLPAHDFKYTYCAFCCYCAVCPFEPVFTKHFFEQEGDKIYKVFLRKTNKLGVFPAIHREIAYHWCIGVAQPRRGYRRARRKTPRLYS